MFLINRCCAFGEGNYAGYINNEKIFSSPIGDENWEKRGHTFTVTNDKPPFDSKITIEMTPRDKEWLASHNIRRKKWLVSYPDIQYVLGTSYL